MHPAVQAFLDGLAVPKRIVDETARHGARKRGLPVADDATVGDLISAAAGFQNEGRGGAGDILTTLAGDLLMDPSSYAAGAVGSTALRAVTPADRLVKVTRWGRPGLVEGDWVMRGGRTLRNYIGSGKILPRLENGALRAPANFFKGETTRVPAGSLRTPGIQGLLQGARIYTP